MKNYRVYFLLLIAFISGLDSKASKDEKHFGKVKSAMGEYVGEIEIKLNEPNKEMITITTYENLETSKGKYEKTSRSIKLNAFLVYSIEIDSVEYFINHLEYAEGKSYPFCCVRLLEGSQNLGLYQWGSNIDPKRQVVKYKNLSSFTLLSSPTLLNKKISMMFLFLKCPELKTELQKKPNGFITAEMDEIARSKEISRLIGASATCL